MINRRCLIAAQVSPARETQAESTHVASPEEDRKQRERIATARQFAIDAARLAAHTHCGNVTVLDVSAVSPVTDFFVIATGTSPRQMRTVCDEIEEMSQARGFRAMSKPGYDGDHWILIDFMDVVVHLFNHDARAFYDLDNLWGDGKVVEWKSE